MNLLAIDTSSENISLCIMRRGKIAVDYNRRIRLGASELITHIDKSLKRIPLDLEDIDVFVVGSGPGSFTGLRISFSIIKAFMMATKKPAIAVSSFSSCAYSLRNMHKRIAVISDARKGLIYSACFKFENGSLKKDGKEKLVEFESIAREKRNHLFVTYDSDLRKRALEYDSDIDFYPQEVYPKARYLLPFAKKRYDNFEFTPIEKLQPLYLHPKTCQVRKKESDR